MSEILDVMQDLGLITDKEGGFIANIFRRMEIAEEEIERAQKEWPNKADVVWNTFTICPSPIIPNTAPEKLWRYHYRQLCRMVALGEDLDMPTGIEAACMVVGVANKVPIRFDVVVKILSDFETAEAFNVEEITTSLKNIGAQYDDDFRKAYRRAYKDKNDGKTRAQRFAARLKERKEA